MVLPMDGEADLVSRLEQQREAIDAVVVEQQLAAAAIALLTEPAATAVAVSCLLPVS